MAKPLSQTDSKFDLQQTAAEAVAHIRSADALLIGAGAGMGVDSGLPDFRGDAGFWKAYPPFKKLNLSFIDMANPKWFRVDPQRAWGFYGHRMMLYRNTVPHEGFKILNKWCQGLPALHFVFTSNVDGHFQKAGFDPERIVEVHGSINHLQCSTNCTDEIWSGEQEVVTIDDDYRAKDPLPKCKNCNGLARPNILMFGDMIWNESRSFVQEDRYVVWLETVKPKKVVAIEIGAGTAIPTVRRTCTRNGDVVIRINPRESQGGKNVIGFPCGALEALKAMDELMTQS